MKNKISVREYKKEEIIAFRKTKELYGPFSNMASGFPLKVNNLTIKSSEALYQALKFPHNSDAQIEILIAKTPYLSKVASKKYYSEVRNDWNNIKIKVMRYCLQLKLAQHYKIMAHLLKLSNPKQIVEYSPNDAFWGAIPKDNKLVGINALGRLIMELRADILENKREIFTVTPPEIDNLLLLNRKLK